MNSTTAGSGPAAPVGRLSQALIGWPANPLNVTSIVSTVVKPFGVGVSSGGLERVRASSRVAVQKAVKSAGSRIAERYRRSSASGRSK